MARLLTDEDFPREAAMRLRALGHDILTAVEAGLANLGIDDDVVLECAIRERRAVVTYNRLHFRHRHGRVLVHAGIVVCKRDDDFQALAARIDAAIRGDPDLHGSLVRITKRGWSRSHEKRDALTSLLRDTWQFRESSRFHLECLGPSRFRLIEVAPDLTVLQRITGYQHATGGVISSREPDLTLAQASVFDAVIEPFYGKVVEAERVAAREFTLFLDGECPELFGPLSERPSLAGNVRPEMLPVWHALAGILAQYGYEAVLLRRYSRDEQLEICALRRRSP